MTRFWMKRKQQKIEEKSSIHKGPLIKIWEITYRATNLWNKFLFLMLKKMKRKTKRFYQSSANANHCLNEQYFMDENSAMNKHCVCWFFFLANNVNIALLSRYFHNYFRLDLCFLKNMQVETKYFGIYWKIWFFLKIGTNHLLHINTRRDRKIRHIKYVI